MQKSVLRDEMRFKLSLNNSAYELDEKKIKKHMWGREDIMLGTPQLV